MAQATLDYPKRWAVADIDYVRANHSTETAAQMAQALTEPVKRVRRLVGLLKNGGHKVAARVPRNVDAVQSVFSGATGAQGVLGDTCGAPLAVSASQALPSQPADLAAYLGATSVRDAATALKVSRATAYRLKEGYWPADARALLKAWQGYKGRSAQRQSGWFLRRVYEGGMVRHAGHVWTAHGLSVRTGELLAVARTEDGTLLVQTLELPAERFTLCGVKK